MIAEKTKLVIVDFRPYEVDDLIVDDNFEYLREDAQ